MQNPHRDTIEIAAEIAAFETRRVELARDTEAAQAQADAAKHALVFGDGKSGALAQAKIAADALTDALGELDGVITTRRAELDASARREKHEQGVARLAEVAAQIGGELDAQRAAVLASARTLRETISAVVAHATTIQGLNYQIRQIAETHELDEREVKNALPQQQFWTAETLAAALAAADVVSNDEAIFVAEAYLVAQNQILNNPWRINGALMADRARQ